MTVGELRKILEGKSDDSPVLIVTRINHAVEYWGLKKVVESGNHIPTVYLEAR